MHKQFSCSQGHHWEVTLDGQFSAAVQCIVCPVCGAAAETATRVEATPSSEPDPFKTVSPPPGEPVSHPSSLLPLPSKDPISIPGYQILGKLGQGGMGVIYRARQIRLKRVVALKMIRPRPEIGLNQLDRFRSEAEAAARLQHANIVQIFEVGEEAGWPYFSLELLEGGSLDKKLAGTPQPARTAALLLETLARATHYAHQRGVVHRDLKPSNVLLTPDGVPKITDFGLAKQLDAEMDHTRSGDVLGTPSYMAPEQAQSQKELIGPLSDVYALGAILYEMLTGRPPFQGTTTLETLDQVRSQDPLPPRRLQPRLPRDLETICLKCLEKEPRKRYASALALAEDLGRFLNHQPIQARPVGQTERLWRWCRRKPALASMTAVLMLVVAGALVALTSLWLQADRNRRQAEANARREEEQRHRATENLLISLRYVEEFCRNLTENQRLQNPDLDGWRQEALHKATQDCEEIVRQESDDPRFRAAQGKAYRLLGQEKAALSRKEGIEYVQQGLAIFDELAAADPGVPEHQFDKALCHLALADFYESNLQLDQAGTACQQGLAVLAPLVREYPDNDDYQSNLAKANGRLGIVYALTNQFDRAEAGYLQAVAIWERLVQKRPGNDAYEYSLAEIYSRLARLYNSSRRQAKAEAAYHQALALQTALANAHRTLTRYQTGLAQTHNNLAVLYENAGRKAEAEAGYRQALEIHARLAGDYPNVADYQSLLGSSYNNLGFLYREKERWTEAEAAYKEALNIWEKLAEKHLEVPIYQERLAYLSINLGNLYRARHRLDEAQMRLQKALAILEKLAHDHPDVGVYQSRLAGTYLNLGHLERDSGSLHAALDWYARGIDTLEALLKKDTRNTEARRFLAKAFEERALAWMRSSQYAEALTDLDRALEWTEGSDQDPLRLKRAAMLARRGEHRRAVEEANALAEKAPESPTTLYETARIHGLCAASIRRDSMLSLDEQNQHGERYAARAVDLLRQSVAKGFKDLDKLAKDNDFEALRDREEFKQLLKESQERTKTVP